MVTEVTTAAADSLTNTAPMGERMALGLQTTLLGLGTVFAVLVILMVVLLLFRLFFYTIPNRKQHAAVDASPAPEAAPAASDVGSDDNGALAAAITAAVAAYLDAEAAEPGQHGSARIPCCQFPPREIEFYAACAAQTQSKTDPNASYISAYTVTAGANGILKIFIP